jgi:hypothetical protein
VRELVDEAALADARHPDEGDELGLALLARTRERPDEQVELSLPPDQRSAGLDNVHPDPRTRLERLPHRHGAGLPLGINGLGLGIADDGLRRPVRRLSDEDAVHGRPRLQPRRRVHHVAGGHPLPRLRPGAELDKRLACIDPDAHLEPLLVTGPVADGQRGAHRPLRIVLVRDGRAEHGHDRIADELLHCAPEALRLAPHATVLARQERVDVLGIHRLRARGEADEVGEQHRHDLALLPHRNRSTE